MLRGLPDIPPCWTNSVRLLSQSSVEMGFLKNFIAQELIAMTIIARKDFLSHCRLQDKNQNPINRRWKTP